MENYIVRIYRRTNSNPESVTGIVENPDSGENIPFHSNEEFVNIFFNSKPVITRDNKQQIIEQRKYRRFKVKNSTLIFDETTDVGEIVDISLGGLSFFCPNMPDELKGSFKVGILCEGVEDFCTGRINCKKLMLGYSGINSHKLKKRFSVEFDILKPTQRMQLEHIIKKYTVGEE